MRSNRVPSPKELLQPTFEAIKFLGGSASNEEIPDRVVEAMDLPDVIVQIPHGKGNQTQLEYNLAWSRTYLKKAGLIVNSQRAVWSLTESGRTTHEINPDEIMRRAKPPNGPSENNDSEAWQETPLPSTRTWSAPWSPRAIENDDSEAWRETLLNILLGMTPDAFERLCQRLLREAGITDVTVTGRPSDREIEGKGHIRIGGLISFPVLFQCKRYRHNLSVEVIWNFRRAMQGQAERGLIITTSRFTADAHREATRDGAPAIDLIDGELLTERLKDLELGVRVKQVEVVEVEKDFFVAI